MHHRITYMYINFQKNRVNRSVKPGAQIYLQKKIASCINLQLPIVTLKKSTPSDMHHRKMYMYMNFQQYRVSRSAKTVDTNLFAKYCIILQIAKMNFEKSRLSDMHEMDIQANFEITWHIRYQITAKKN